MQAGVSILIHRDDIVYYGKRTEGKTWPGRLQFPGGRIEGIESPTQAAKRELREEADLELVPPFSFNGLKLITRKRFRWPHGGVFDCYLYTLNLDATLHRVMYNMEPKKNVGWYMIHKDSITTRFMNKFRPPCQHLLRTYLDL